MSKAQALAFAGLALLLGACSGWPRGAGFGLFGGAPAMPATASIDLDSEPQGAEAKTSAGGSCQTPCTLEVPTGGGFSVTFAREGFAPQTVGILPARSGAGRQEEAGEACPQTCRGGPGSGHDCSLAGTCGAGGPSHSARLVDTGLRPPLNHAGFPLPCHGNVDAWPHEPAIRRLGRLAQRESVPFTRERS